MKREWILWVMVAVVGAIAIMGRCDRREPQTPVAERVVRVVERDTVVVGQPVAVVCRRVDTVQVMTVDSVIVEAAREQREYSGDDYHAWVSGVGPQLDSIHVYGLREREVVERLNADITRQRHWSFSAGIAIDCGARPFVAVTYTF